MNDFTVSVVIPCYNAAPFLRQTIESALNQTYLPLEVIVVDDGSTDDSAAIAGSYGPPVRVIHQKNSGESVARNHGIDRAQGRWIALLDADDVWMPDKLRRLKEAFEETNDSTIVCIYSDFFLFGTRNHPHVQKPEYHAANDYRVQMLLDWSVPTITALVRRDVAEQVRFPENIRHGEDPIFFLMVREKGRFLRIAEPLAGYRKHASGQTASPENGWLSIIARCEWFLDNEHRYTPNEQVDARIGLSELIVAGYHSTRGRRNGPKASQARRWFRAVRPDQRVPSSLKYPRFIRNLVGPSFAWWQRSR